MIRVCLFIVVVFFCFWYSFIFVVGYRTRYDIVLGFGFYGMRRFIFVFVKKCWKILMCFEVLFMIDILLLCDFGVLLVVLWFKSVIFFGLFYV